jgi:hypothetical protein
MHTDYLFEAAAQLGNVSLCEAESLGRLVLALPERRPGRHGFRSTLNNDGSPMQLCVSASARRKSVRFVGDPGAFLRKPERRDKAARAALSRLLSATHSESLAPVCRRLLESIVPARLNGLNRENSSVLWLAAGLAGNRMAMYVKARWENETADWLRALAAFRSILAQPEEAESIIQDLRNKARIVSVGIEGESNAVARLKLYWRLTRPVLLSSLPVRLLGDAALTDFLRMTVRDRPLPATGLVLSTGFSISNGAIEDVKIDVCSHCLPQSPEIWLELMDRLAERYSLSPIGIHRLLITGQTEMALLGFGIDRSMERRMNVYLKAPSAR